MGKLLVPVYFRPKLSMTRMYEPRPCRHVIPTLRNKLIGLYHSLVFKRLSMLCIKFPPSHVICIVSFFFLLDTKTLILPAPPLKPMYRDWFTCIGIDFFQKLSCERSCDLYINKNRWISITRHSIPSELIKYSHNKNASAYVAKCNSIVVITVAFASVHPFESHS